VTRLAFLSPHEADVEPVSPVAHLRSSAYTDVSGLGKLEVRGGVPAGAIPIGIDRGLVVVDGDPRAERDRLTAEGYRVYDLSSALAGLEVEGERLMRRLTELDLDALPAVGSVARGTPAVIERTGPERFRLFVPQELAQYVAEVVDDQAKGLA
jgi:sarcosine oxidase gamma subunit